MPYSNPLDPTTPADTDLRSQGDDRIREVKAALLERLLTVFVDMNINPLAFIAGVIPTAALANLAVATAKLADLSVTPAKLALLAVTTPTINDLAVTNPKVAADAIAFTNLLTAMRAKMPQFRSAILTLTNGTTYAAGSFTDVVTGLSVSAGNFAHMVGMSSTDSTLPGPASAALKFSFVQVIGTGAISLRIHNSSGSLVTLAANYSIGVWIAEPLS